MCDQRALATLGFVGLLLAGVTAALSGCDTRAAADDDEPVTDGGVHACDAPGPYGGGPPWGFDASTSRIAHWDGTEWSVVQSGSPGRLDSVSGSGPGDIWAAGNEPMVGALLLHWDGTSWSDARGHGLEGAPSVWAGGPDDAWATGAYHWDGSSWTQAATPQTTWSLWGVRGSAPDDVWFFDTRSITGVHGAHYHAGTWSLLDHAWYGGDNAFEASPYSFWPSAPDDVWVAGGATTIGPPWTAIVHWDGSSWTNATVSDPGWMYLYGIWGSAPDDVWATGQLWEMPVRAIILRWDGTSWKEHEPRPAASYCGAIWGTASDDVWMSCMGWCSEAFHVFHWDGASWTKTATFDWYPESFWGSGRDDVWLVGWGGPVP